MEEDIVLQDQVRQYLTTNKILKKDFAARVGVSPVLFSHWLAGRVRFDRQKLLKILQIIKQ